MFNCPNCSNTIGEYPEAGAVAVVCSGCTFKYDLVGGRVTDFTSSIVTAPTVGVGLPPVRHRAYELRLEVAPRVVERFAFETSREDNWIRIREGALVAVVCSMRGEKREELLFVVDRSSGERYVLAKPGQRSLARARAGGLAAAVIVGGIALAFSAPVWLTFGAAALAGVGATRGLARALRPAHTLAQDEQLSLEAHQGLLDEKRRLLASRDEVLNEIHNRQLSQRLLRDLRERMVAVDASAYVARIAAIDAALGTLDAQLDIDNRLVKAYDRSLTIVDIEYDSTAATSVIPADGETPLSDRLAELREVEDRHAQLTRELSANAEVELLLRRTGP